ncbi:hypothetical protein I543_2329 [Mycobacteroides abscessus 21]|uniref:Uncharacterized protein n=1 Tax=Mycobacteroides abscessus 21 TaxID=1299324 RepID=A0A829Q935_9MYCO|nr:hypothetical protein I543_2329 [Mycobacteroides abscessus 21]
MAVAAGCDGLYTRALMSNCDEPLARRASGRDEPLARRASGRDEPLARRASERVCTR